MGIEAFFSFLSKQYPGTLQRNKPSLVSSLAVDANSLFHQAAQKVYGYGESFSKERIELVAEKSERELTEELHSVVWSMIINLVTMANPQDMLILAVDGLAPMAKIQQQRQRRYKAALHSSSPFFDSNAITPGTEFMIALDSYLREQIALEKMFLPPQVLYSSHLVPGEGEHKIMQFYREGRVGGPKADEGGAHIIHGLDSDLIMLSMMLPQKRVFLMREDVEHILNIERLREKLRDDLHSRTAVEDFVVMMFLIGNDFVPRMRAVADLSTSIRRMIYIYRKVHLPLASRGGILWKNFAYFLSFVQEYEAEWLRDLASQTYEFRSFLFEDSIVEGVFDFPRFRTLWYRYVLSPPPTSAALGKALGFSRTSLEPTVEQIRSMILEYLRGMEWTLLYYRRGMEGVNTHWWYPYYFAPLLTDLVVVASLVISHPSFLGSVTPPAQAAPYSVVDQLLSVIPPSSRALVPEEFQVLYLPTSPIYDLFPTLFLLDEEGKQYEWQMHAILPFADLERLQIATAMIPWTLTTRTALQEEDHWVQERRRKQDLVPDPYRAQQEERKRRQSPRKTTTWVPREKEEERVEIPRRAWVQTMPTFIPIHPRMFQRILPVEPQRIEKADPSVLLPILPHSVRDLITSLK